MGKIPQTMITPPLIRGIEKHTLTKDPAFKSAMIHSVFFYEHFGETTFFHSLIYFNSAAVQNSCIISVPLAFEVTKYDAKIDSF